ncbi:MAG: hypothetical protein HY235_12120 [Acidobacteria bacterium]|nr:hypothetical protein [Acidobacteriota bacterium]
MTSRFSDLCAPRQALVRLLQTVNYGQVRGLVVRAGQPVFHPEPTVLMDVRLDSDESARPEIELADFVLRHEVRRLMAQFDQLKEGVVERIEVRAGIPRRVLIEANLTEVRR